MNNRILKCVQGVSLEPQGFQTASTLYIIKYTFLALFFINSEYNEYFTKTHVEKVKSCRRRPSD